MYNKEINELIYKFENLGISNSSDGAILIGKAPHIGSRAWLNTIFPKLDDTEVKTLEEELKTDIPSEYKYFLKGFSNGISILTGTLALYGLRRNLNRSSIADVRQPFSPVSANLYERPSNAKDSYFFIGSYHWDGSRLYIDKETNLVHCCQMEDATSQISWPSFEEMLLSELKRLYALFDEKGVEIDEDQPTIPYKL